MQVYRNELEICSKFSTKITDWKVPKYNYMYFYPIYYIYICTFYYKLLYNEKNIIDIKRVTKEILEGIGGQEA